MKRYLLDTNIISELGKPSPHPNIVNFVSALDTLWLSIITVHELKYGLNLLPEGNRRLELEATIGAFIDQQARFIIPIQDQEAEAAADLRAMARKIGKPCHLADSLIAGTAKAHDLTIVTRNEKDFKYFGIEVENPWF
jgi:predicted nucleic acid-binding protein